MLLSLALATTLGCGRGPSSSPAKTPDRGPVTQADFERLYNPKLAPLGLRISRAGRTAEIGDDDYDPAGKNVSLYLTPVAPAAKDDPAYLDRLPKIVELFLPDVLRRVPGAAAVDVCQEPTDATPGIEPLPVTTFIATRAQAFARTWRGLSTVDIVAASKRSPRELTVLVSTDLAATPEWADIREEALKQAQSSG